MSVRLSAFQAALEIYFGLDGKDEVAYRLISRYWWQVSWRLRLKHTWLGIEAKRRSKERLKEAFIARDKHPLNLPPPWEGKTLVVPLHFGD